MVRAVLPTFVQITRLVISQFITYVHHTIDRVEDKLSKVQAAYGAGSCCLLKINSRWPGSIVLGDNPWSHVARHYTLHNSNGEVHRVNVLTQTM